MREIFRVVSGRLSRSWRSYGGSTSSAGATSNGRPRDGKLYRGQPATPVPRLQHAGQLALHGAASKSASEIFAGEHEAIIDQADVRSGPGRLKENALERRATSAASNGRAAARADLLLMLRLRDVFDATQPTRSGAIATTSAIGRSRSWKATARRDRCPHRRSRTRSSRASGESAFTGSARGNGACRATTDHGSGTRLCARN